MRFRIILPLANVILGVALFRLGDMQVRRIVIANGGAPEGMPDIAAKAKYAHYALNAPAWALLGDTREMRWGWSTYWTGHDLHYFLAVMVMWFLIGLKLDRKLIGKPLGHAQGSKWWNRIVAWGYLLYGLFLCYRLVPGKPYFMSLKGYLDYLVTVLRSVLSGGYGWWWYPLGLAWGLGLVSAGLYSLFHSRRPAT
jgi:hypothetical protein